MVLGWKYRDADGVPIVRPAKQLGEMGKVIYRELEKGVRRPEGARGWSVGGRRGIKAPGRFLTNRELYNCPDDCSLVKSYKVGGVVGGNSHSLDLMGDLEEPGSEVFRINFANI